MITLKELKKVITKRYFVVAFDNAADSFTYITLEHTEKCFDNWIVEYFTFSKEFNNLLIKICHYMDFCPGIYDDYETCCCLCTYKDKCIEENKEYGDWCENIQS